jgi:DNA-binding response OmpR family regulator
MALTTSASTFSPRVLVVDDHCEVADFLTEALSLHGIVARAAYGGAEALQLAQAFHPDALLLDLGMMNIDGFDVAAAMRMSPSCPCLVALSAWDDPATRARTRAAGFDAHLRKPASIDTIVATLKGIAMAERRPGLVRSRAN